MHATPAPKASKELNAIPPPRQGIHLENFNVIIQSDPPSGTQYISLTVQNLPSLQPPPYISVGDRGGTDVHATPSPSLQACIYQDLSLR